MKLPSTFAVVALLAGSIHLVAEARQQAVFRSETNYIEIVASVTDKSGQFVTGLTVEDFEVKEQGRRQSLDNFSFVTLPASGQASMPASYRADVPDTARVAEGRLYLIYLNGATAANTPLVRKLATQFVQNHLRPGDRAAIWDSQFPLRDVTFTGDKTRLQADIDPYTGSAYSEGDLPFAFRCGSSSMAALPIGQREECQAALAEPYSQLTKAVDWFNAIQGRRKSIVLFAGGWNGATEPVSRADITLYAVDVRGLAAMDSDVLGGGLTGPEQALAVGNKMNALSATVNQLYTLAQRTGGFALINRNEFSKGFERIVEANSQYYVLGYASSYTQRDRVFRELDVKVKRSGLKVQARRGYYPRF